MTRDAERAWHEHDDGLLWPDGNCDACAGTKHHRRHYVLTFAGLAAVRDEAARDAGRAHAAFALECAAEDFEVEQRAKARAEGALHPWSEAVTFLAARATALRAAPPTEGES